MPPRKHRPDVAVHSLLLWESTMIDDKPAPAAAPASGRIIDDYFPESDAQAELGFAQRTIARFRAEGCGPPWMYAGGRVWLHREGSRQWLAGRVQRAVREEKRRRPGPPPGTWPSKRRKPLRDAAE